MTEVEATGVGFGREGQHLERNSSWRDEYLKWICGFANAQSGRLVIGKDDRGARRRRYRQKVPSCRHGSASLGVGVGRIAIRSRANRDGAALATRGPSNGPSGGQAEVQSMEPGWSSRGNMMLQVCLQRPVSAAGLRSAGDAGRSKSFRRSLGRLLNYGALTPTRREKPTSPLRKHCLTDAGRSVVGALSSASGPQERRKSAEVP